MVYKNIGLYLRLGLVFPTLQKNQSPLGSKVSLYIHRISKKDWSPLPRIADQINGLVKILNTKYTALSEQQADYLSMDDTRRPAEFNVRLVLVDPLVLFFWFHESTSEKKIG